MFVRLCAVLLGVILAGPAYATAFFVAPSTHSPAGSDANNGTSAATPWLSANHAVNCGDTITALADTGYTNTQFNDFTGGGQRFGTVTCTAGNNVVWLQCVTFAACTLTDASAGNQPAIVMDQSYWGIQGFVVSRTNGGGSTDGACIYVTGETALVHHVIVANNVLNGCLDAGVTASTNSGFGTDYIAFIGNAVYNAASGTAQCGSGVNTIGQAAFDSVPGTHTYIAGNIVWKVIEGVNCASSGNTDGECFQIDVSDGTYATKANPYLGQTVIENNLALGCGGPGYLYTKHKEGAQIIINNTAYGNLADANRNNFGGASGELQLSYGSNIQIFNNLITTNLSVNGTVSCSGNTVQCPSYAFLAFASDVSSVVDNNWFVNIATTGQNSIINQANNLNGQLALGGHNIMGIDPKMACGGISACNTAIPGAPSCGGKANVVDCMSATIANFTPTAPGAIGMGYQRPNALMPSVGSLHDSLFPVWLCNVTLPTGLISKHC